MTNVLKRGGLKKQAFSPSKIRRSVENAAKEAKLSPAQRKKLVKEIADPVIEFAKKKRVVRSIDIRKALLGRLDRKSKAVSRAWKRFEKKK